MSDDLSVNPSRTTSPPEQRVKHGPLWVFFGDDGLRVGWSALLFVVIFVVLFVMLGMGVKLLHVHLPDRKLPLSPLWALAGELIQAIVVLVATWIMARIEGRRLAVYGYAGRAKLARFLFGLVWGFVALSSLVAVLWKTHLLAFDAGHLQGLTAWEYGLAWLVTFFLVGLAEESLLRGYLQYTLTRGIGFWWGALLMSILFGAIHGTNKGESPVGLFSAGAVGLVFCISLWYTGSLWWAIGFHAAWDWAQSFFYGTPDSGMVARGHLMSEHPVGPLLWSGGPTGPEGSLYIIPLLLIMALAMWLWWR
ncbi:MAG: protease family protein, partial [Acidobacteriaceae bacterium]|nr:protease family protein [Acidobacteriaceae bacterium]